MQISFTMLIFYCSGPNLGGKILSGGELASGVSSAPCGRKPVTKVSALKDFGESYIIVKPFLIWASGFLSGLFRGDKAYCYANFFYSANFLLFWTKFRRENSFGVGGIGFRGILCPLWKKASH